MDALRGRWRADCTPRHRRPTRRRRGLGPSLLRRWREPHRRYHDVTHLGEVLGRRHAVRGERRSPTGTGGRALAVWFHDAVYAVDSPDTNEAESAALASEALTRLGTPAGRGTGSRPSCSTPRRTTSGPRAGTGQDVTADRRARRRPLGALGTGRSGSTSTAGRCARSTPHVPSARTPAPGPRCCAPSSSGRTSTARARRSIVGDSSPARTSLASSPASRAERRRGERPPEVPEQSATELGPA